MRHVSAMNRDEVLHVVWFKRDLRVVDHGALAQAGEAARGGGGRILGVYFVEPTVTAAEDFAGRHWAVAREALRRKTGARGLRAILEEIMNDVMYELPGKSGVRECVITDEVVQHHKDPILVYENEGEQAR